MRLSLSMLRFETYILVMYYDTCNMTVWEIFLSVNEMLWCYSASIFCKINYACFGIIEEVASKSLYDYIICVIYHFKGLWCYRKHLAAKSVHYKGEMSILLSEDSFCIGNAKHTI
jgi:hypothetical protein